MNRTVALLGVIALASTADAREHANWTAAAPYRYDRELVADDDAQSARALAISGGVLTGVGAALLVTATVLGIVAARDNFGPLWSSPPGPLGMRQIAAIGIGTGGAALLAVGIPLLAVGKHRLRKLDRDARLGLAPAPSANGARAAGGSIQLTVRF